jgi:lipopolysaccharide transport system permease protein
MATPSFASVMFDANDPRPGERALADLREGLGRWRLAWRLALLDLRNRYRGSALGPIWMTLTVAVMVAGLGVLYSTLLRIDVARYLPHLAVSLVVWNWMAGSINDACQVFIAAEGIIRQLRMPCTVLVLRCVFRNMLSGAHSVPVIVVVFLLFGHRARHRGPAASRRARRDRGEPRRGRVPPRHDLRAVPRCTADRRQRRAVRLLPHPCAVED